MNKARVQTVTLHRTKTTDWDQFHPIHCGSIAEASSVIVQMAKLVPPSGKLFADPDVNDFQITSDDPQKTDAAAIKK